jgi:hypothetical protein
MSTDPQPDDPAQQIAALERQLKQLDHELDLAHLHAEVAITVTPLIRHFVAGFNERVAIVVDIVDCWMHLPENVRKAYGPETAASSGLARFAEDYTTAVDADPTAGAGLIHDPASTSPDEDRRCHIWHQHVAEVYRRTDFCEPPPATWLDRFPLTDDPA